MRTYLNDNWQFFNQWNDAIFEKDGGEAARLPHSHAIAPFNCFDETIYQYVSGYKRVLHLADVAGKTFLLTFEGVAHRAEVFVNGIHVATHECGYTAFTVDITAHVHKGDNQLVVKVDSRKTLNQPPFGFVIDYQTYGGIYRDVYLEEKRGVYVQDAFVKALPNCPVQVDVTLGNFTKSTQALLRIKNERGVAFSAKYTCKNANYSVSADVKLDLWSVNNPNLYTLELSVGNDVYETTFGVRSAVFTKDGFYLNGEKLKIIGLNRHQSYPYVGYAMPESMQRLDAKILKEKLRVNAVRTSHYPQSHYFIDECDKLGLLVFTEIPGWQYIGDEDWKQIAKQNVREMIQQYRNHPSIVLWGVRINESLDNDELYAETNAIAHSLDDTRQTGGVRYLRRSHLLEDVYTFNDFNRDGATDRNEVCPSDVPYLVTEYNGHMYPTKSYDDVLHRLEHTLRYARMLDGVFASDNTCGAFGWCMFDYHTNSDFGSGDRICYHGVTDMFRNPKTASGVFVAMGTEPFLDVTFSSELGDYPEAIIKGMYVLTNCDSVKVYKAGVFVREFTHQDSPFKHLPNAPILIDNNFESSWGSEANVITLEGYVGDKLVLTKKVGSMKSYSIEVTPSSRTLCENNSYDVVAVQIVARDQFGNVCPYLNKAVKLEASGAVELIGESVVALQGGMFGTYVKTKGVKGKGTLRVDDKKIEFEVQ